MKKKWINYILFTFLIIDIVGCASSSIVVESVPPGADIYLSQTGQIPAKIGQSPMNVDLSSFKLNRESVTISVTKFGFKKETVLIPYNSISQTSKLGVVLTEDLNQKNSQDIDSSLEEIARGVAKIQELVRSKDFEQAHTNINGLLLKYPNISTLYGLQGNTFYLQKNIDKALSSYKKSEAISPNPETQRMITKLEGIRKGGQQ